VRRGLAQAPVALRALDLFHRGGQLGFVAFCPTSISVPKFGHGILMDAETLHVLKIVDWDEAGYFPPEFQVWSVERAGYEALYENEEQRRRLTELML
jgi:hypothetical protein